MDADHADNHLARIAGAIAEPARARMLCCLLDGHARTSTELSVVGEVSPSTASAHLARLRDERLIEVVARGKHRYYTLASADVGAALEALLVVAGLPRPAFQPNTPDRLRHARTCYDHMAGTVAVALHDQIATQGWLAGGGADYALSPAGEAGFARAGVDLAALRKLRRRFACPCLDWSERRPHIGGALGAALLQLALRRGWVERELDSRALTVAAKGQRQLLAAFAPTD
ncbi:ArsR/SmtB family transcription factor [Rugamonas sp. CCM 8940]|uniref:ArsR/SmtB family transcription factor n=1 Tax=Rugamonas sp. CCM 8940 TaxID=2765359 RepID=UPI0018F744BB|nr:helix-turn-helix transcriptional regulator [Rugamonas sp. CCM 8940]MBJ7312143.1 helix-turn-helix transcriptional regulator [Rugamonas sp. CCM 8940]